MLTTGGHQTFCQGRDNLAVHNNDNNAIADLKALVSLLNRKTSRILFNGFDIGVEVCSAMVRGEPATAEPLR